MQDDIIKNCIIKKQKNFPLWDIAFLTGDEDESNSAYRLFLTLEDRGLVG